MKKRKLYKWGIFLCLFLWIINIRALVWQVHSANERGIIILLLAFSPVILMVLAGWLICKLIDKGE